MSVGLIALLDDVAALAKVAAASLDDIVGQAAKAGAKAAGVVIDDAAVTPRYVVGFASDRELPIVRRIAIGSLKNKLLILLPAALALSLFAPWAIMPLLMLGGAFLCYEGAEKVLEMIWPHAAEVAPTPGAAPPDPKRLEEERIGGAIQTDFILSAEIMAITLGTMPQSVFWIQAVVLAAVGLGITIAVYGVVALIVKADDAGISLAVNATPVSSVLGIRRAPLAPTGADRTMRPVTQAIGRGLVSGMPGFLKLLGMVGTAAMIWVGGGIIIHGFEEFGLGGLGHALQGVAHSAALAVPAIGGALEWLVTAVGSGVVGLLIGSALVLLLHKILFPAIARIRDVEARPPH
jgi:predicted DNA repair protein MutK